MTGPRARRVMVGAIVALLVGASCSDTSGDGGDDSSPVGTEATAAPTIEPGDGERPSLPTVAPNDGDDQLDPFPNSTTTSIAPPVPSDVLFETNDDTLKAEATPYLTTLADDIRAGSPDADLHFVGHTDTRGSDEHNADLSRRRAQAVLQWFADHDFDPARLSADGAGERCPVTVDTASDGQFDHEAGQTNRRVVIIITEHGAEPAEQCPRTG